MSSKLALFIVTHTQCTQGVNHTALCYLNWWPGLLVFCLDVHCLTLFGYFCTQVQFAAEKSEF